MEDLISRQDAINALRLYFDCAEWETEVEPIIEAVINDSVSMIECLPFSQQWIPVKWREPTEEESKYYTYMADCEMPDDEQEILVTCNGYVYKDVCYYDDGFSLDSGADWQDVTAWMPLPEPYREGK